MPKILIGTSGWMYKHWNEKFFPKDLTKDRYLNYYSKEFSTVEINSSFYHMPSVASFKKWYGEVGRGFVFSVKLNQYLTHWKRMIIDHESLDYLQAFTKNMSALKEKLSALLIQLPPSQKFDPQRLDKFLKTIRSLFKNKKHKPDLAIEFRHLTWFRPETYKILKKNKIALVIASSAKFPSFKEFTAPFSYLRFHSPRKSSSSNYSPKELEEWGKFIAKNKNKIKKFYLYFNNDANANAIRNAEYLKKLI